jgi:hypothetical protein
MTVRFAGSAAVLALGAWGVAWGAETSLRPAPFRGQAYEPGSAAVLYTEKHENITRGGVSLGRTEYRDPAGTLIAERTLDFSRHVFKPNYRLVDLRDGYEEGAEVVGAGDGKTARVRVFVRDKREEPLRERTITVPEPAVIDGGFNAFVKANWSELSAGRPVAFNFVAPARRDWFSFEAVPAGYEGAPEAPEGADEKTTRTFVIRPEKAALRLLVPPILVTYDRETHRVKEYRGISNVNNSRGKSFQIRIEYPAGGP